VSPDRIEALVKQAKRVCPVCQGDKCELGTYGWIWAYDAETSARMNGLLTNYGPCFGVVRCSTFKGARA
jgi:hypothetical protein